VELAGRRAVYASATKSLALLEVLVHLDVGRPLPRFVAFGFEVDAKLVETLAPGRLPRSWRTSEGHAADAAARRRVARGGRTLALAVPSDDRAGRERTTCSIPRTRHSRSSTSARRRRSCSTRDFPV
jgi:hypothetical protein